ncbi:MAG: sodium ion-translocating decarboxylase subunit beta [Deltaproteobacteria bacterium]|nr:sodium ion-translocating decarboxylase subunit beta [Deltaproteobacteria bacterium]
MPGELSLLVFAFTLLVVLLAFGLGYVAIFFRLQPVFLLPLSVGLLLGNLPALSLPQTLGPFWHTLQAGLDSGLYVALILLGWGAGANLGFLIAHPRKLLWGLVTPVAFLLVLLLARLLGFTAGQSGSIALIGGGDGISAAFLATQLAPELSGPISLAAFSLVGLYFLLQPGLVRLLTTRQERMLRLSPTRKVTRRESLIFAVAGFLFTILFIPRAALLTGMFFLGAIIRESGVLDRLSRTLANRLAEIMALLLGLAAGSRCQALALISMDFLTIIILGLLALLLANALVILAIKAVNLFLREKINPLLGAAALGLVPDAAHLTQVICRREDPHGNIYPQALALSQAALLISTLTAGLLWSILGRG